LVLTSTHVVEERTAFFKFCHHVVVSIVLKVIQQTSCILVSCKFHKINLLNELSFI
jgi:hypothetical protein